VILTCDPGNIASRKTIETLGGQFLGEVTIPPDDPAYLSGSRRRLRYQWPVM
jgi:predicted acetyltransferase